MLRTTNGLTEPDLSGPEFSKKLDEFVMWLDEQIAVFEDEMRTRDPRPFFVYAHIRPNHYEPVPTEPDEVRPLTHNVFITVDLQALAPTLGGILHISDDSDVMDIIKSNMTPGPGNRLGNPLALWARNAASKLPKPSKR